MSVGFIRYLVSSIVAITAPAVFLSNSASSGETTGYLGIESRLFFEDALYANQSDNSNSLAANLEYFHDWDDGKQRIAMIGFYRWDSEDENRQHGDFRELYWRKSIDDYNIYFGVRKIFWGVTETVHLVDIINQDDLVENIDGEDKLGQPLVSVLVEKNWGTLEIFGLLGFREKTYPGESGRLRTPLPVDKNNVLYQSDDAKDHIDFALRWSQVYGDWDVGLSHFSGTSRDPLLLPMDNNQNELQPYYAQIHQTGLDVQATLEDWLWKLEAITLRERNYGQNSAFVGGFEYTLVGVAESSVDIGLLMEYQFDDRRGIRQPSSQNDLALGVRITLNDTQNTDILAAVTTDLDNNSRFFSIEASRRLTDQWFLESELRIFSHVADEDINFVFRDEDYFQVEIRRYF